jgi:fumarate hydratase subunit alpha/L(+)-tartrate dehydratase alpha subunit
MATTTITAVGERFYQTVEETSRELYIKALKEMPPDIREGLARAFGRESHETGKGVLGTILDNIQVADDRKMLVCQDTGIPVFFVTIGTGVYVDGARIEQGIRRGCERATREHPFRSSIVSPITRRNDQTSTGYRVPVIHWEFAAGADYVDLLHVPKGSGSENQSFMKMLVPADGVGGIKRFVLDCVFGAGGQPCPPIIVGVGVGGSADLVTTLAKKAISRPLGSKNPDPEVAGLEDELLDLVNETGIGPMGLGGVSTALAVQVEHAATHITMNPVAVNIQCWAARRARATLWADGRVEVGF